MPESILETLAPDLYVTGSDVSARHSVDWTRANSCLPDVVFLPRYTDDVAQILKICHAAKQPLVVQGGMTGLSGGATPQPGEWALSLERLSGITEIDPDQMTLTAGAGTPLQTIQDAARDAGAQFPLDLGARGSCLAGGIVATNAGGNQVMRYGMTRALVLGLVAVLADGTIVPARNRLLKNNAGFDLKQLFIGSEGTLGVITEITFRMHPRKTARQTALCGLATFDDVLALLRKVSRDLETVCSFEVMWANYYHPALAAAGVADPLGGAHEYYVLLEAEGAREKNTEEAFHAVLEDVMEAGLLSDAALAQNRAQAKVFWAIRDGAAVLLQEIEAPATFDIGIPVTSMEQFANETRSALLDAFPDCCVMIFGHIADGNLHIVASTGAAADVEAIYDLVYKKTSKFTGTITAEHGIGQTKKKWLSCSRSAAEIDLMRRLKEMLDPRGIINPGRVI